MAKQHKISSRQDGDTRNGHIDDQHDQGRVQITAAFSSGNLAPELLQTHLQMSQILREAHCLPLPWIWWIHRCSRYETGSFAVAQSTQAFHHEVPYAGYISGFSLEPSGGHAARFNQRISLQIAFRTFSGRNASTLRNNSFEVHRVYPVQIGTQLQGIETSAVYRIPIIILRTEK